MASPTWTGGGNDGNWTNTANWSTGAVPVSGDNVSILATNQAITTNLNQSAVIVASLTIAGQFSGPIASTATIPAPLQIGVSGPVLINTTSTNISLDFGATSPQVIVSGTGAASGPAFGQEAFRFRNGGAATSLYIAGTSSVGVATDTSGIVATLASWNLSAGTLNMSSGVTWTTGNQLGGIANVTSSGALLQQQTNQAQTLIGGTGSIATIGILGQASLNNRPAAGFAFNTINVAPGAQANCQNNAAPFNVQNPINMALGSTFLLFDAAQVGIGGTNAVQALDFVDSGGTGDFTITLAAGTTGSIVYSATPATLVTNISAALVALYGVGAGPICSGATLAAIALDFSGSGVQFSPQTLAIITKTTGVNFTSTPSTTTPGVDSAPFTFIAQECGYNQVNISAGANLQVQLQAA